MSKSSSNLPYEKVGKNEPVCIADEIPFEIPESWEWCRLSDVFSVLNGDRGKNYPSKSTLSSIGIPFISALNLNGTTVIDDDNLLCMSEEQYNRLGNGKLVKDDVVVCIRGSLGKHGRYPFERGAIASSLVILRPHLNISIISDYIMMYLDTPMFFAEIKKYDNGTAQPNLAAKSLELFFVPIPPLDEQQRILDKVHYIENYIHTYDNVFSKLDVLNSSFSDELKKSILQQAVMGRLVPQNASDEPASVLLDRIREEKNALIKAGKLKKDKHESIIYRRDNSHYEKRDGQEVCIDDEIPFEIPNTWEWARASSIGSMVRGKGIKRTETVPKGVPCVRYGEIYTSYNVSFSDTISFIDESLDESCLHFSTGDIIFTLTGENKVDIAKGVAYLGNEKVAAGGDLAYWTAHGMNPLYLVYYMASPYCIERKRRTATGDIIVHISTDKVGSFLVPIPPLKEQDRIVEAISRAFSKVSAL